MEIEEFLEGLYGEFVDIEELLRKITRGEKVVRDDLLEKHGFLIKSYSIRYQALPSIHLDDLELELEHIIEIEADIAYQLKRYTDILKKIHEDVGSVTAKVHMHLLKRYYEDAVKSTRQVITILQELKKVIVENQKIHKKKLDKKTIDDINNLEKHISSIMKLIDLLKQTVDKLKNVEEHEFFKTDVTYGRAMAKYEFKQTKKHNKLCCSKNPTPVFDCPDVVMARVLRMSKDQRKVYFSAIGVQNATNFIIFETRRKPINIRPIPQSNGLKEFKLPKDTKIKILKAA